MTVSIAPVVAQIYAWIGLIGGIGLSAFVALWLWFQAFEQALRIFHAKRLFIAYLLNREDIDKWIKKHNSIPDALGRKG